MIYVKLFAIFFRIGLFSFGGGLAMLPLIFQSVQEFGVMTSQAFSDLVALSQVTPGPMAVNAATFVGYNFGGITGAAVSTIGVCLPAFVIMMIVSSVLDKFKNSRIVEGAFAGIRPVTVGLIGSAVLYVSETTLVNGSLISTDLFTSGAQYFNFIPIVIFAVTILLTGVLKMKPITVMIIMGIAGAFICG